MTGRTTRRDLTLNEIVKTAAHIVRAEGEKALSMRRVARMCSVTPMALYNHVADKEALLDLVVDHVIGESTSLEAPSDQPWRDALIAFCCRFRRGLLENPGAATIVVRRPVPGPNLAKANERLFVLLKDAGLDDKAVVTAADALLLLTIGSIAYDLSRPEAVREKLLEIVATHEVPHLSAHMASYAHADREARYVRALNWLLDGITHTENTHRTS